MRVSRYNGQTVEATELIYGSQLATHHSNVGMGEEQHQVRDSFAANVPHGMACVAPTAS